MNKVTWVVIVILVALAIVATTISGDVLESNDNQIVFYNNDTNDTIVKLDISQGEEFSIGYTHSLYKTKQWEFFHVTENDELMLARLEFESADAADYYEHDVDVAEKSDELVYGNWYIEKNQVIDEVIYRIPYLHPMIIKYNDEEFDLRELGDSGDQVLLKLERR